MPNIMDSMDQPTIDGINTYFISKAAVKAGLKVSLSGLGGDELFGGYPSFQQVPRMVNIFQPFTSFSGISKAFLSISHPFLKHFSSPKYAGLFLYGGSYGGAYLLRRGMFMPWELFDLLDKDIARIGFESLQTLPMLEKTAYQIKSNHLKVSALEMSWYMRNQLLRDADWAGMAHSLEIRVPFIDLKLLENIAPFLCYGISPGKYDLASTPAVPIPAEILARRKTGFSVPIRKWLDNKIVWTKDRGLRGWAKMVYANYIKD